MPYCSWVLAELGANVVKVERPGKGDVIRGWDSAVRGLSTGFVWLNAGKRDLVADLRQPGGREVVLRLAARSDVFCENFAPGVADRLGLGAAELRRRNRRLVYCSLSGYGQTGPYRDVKAYDLLIQGESGMLLTTGYPDAPAKIGLPITDLIGGTNAALAVVLALLERGRTGEGAYLDIAMLDGALPWLGYYPQHFWATGAEPPRSGLRHQYICPYGPYLAADGRYVNLVVAGEEDWRRLVKVVGHPEWEHDPRFATVEARRDHREELEPLVEAAIAAEPQRVWLDRLAQAGLPYGQVRGIGEVLAHPQVAARGLLTEADSPVGPVPLVRFPLAPDNPQRAGRRVPALGEHTDQVLTELGYQPSEIEALRSTGVVA
jgi:itaconate CoA-transferase